MIQSIKAHDGPVYSLAIRPDKRGFVTGSADKDVKFWDFDLLEKSAVSAAPEFAKMPVYLVFFSSPVGKVIDIHPYANSQDVR
jgi:WD40 repeat protein